MPSRRHLSRKEIFSGVGVAVLAILTGGVVVAAVVSPVPEAPVSSQIASYYSDPPKIVEPEIISALGDSYTGGSGEGGAGNKGWPQRVVDILNGSGYKVLAGVTASGGTGYVTRGPNGSVFSEKAADVMNDKTDVAVIFGSINDRDQPLDAIAAGAARTLDVTRAEAPSAKIVMVGPAWRTPVAPDDMLDIRDTLRDVANAHGVTFVDPIEERWLMDRPDLIGFDLVHPTDEGHAVLAELMAPHLVQFLNKLPD